MNIVHQHNNIIHPSIDTGMVSLAQHAPNGWVVWQHVGSRKVPHGYNRKKVNKAAKDDALMTYAQAHSTLRRFSDRFDGVGLYMRAPVLGIDLDDVVTWHDGEPVYRHDAITIMTLLDTYTELSPSGTGVHCYVRYDGDHTTLPNTRHYLLPKGGKIAFYRGTNDGYLTITGRSILPTTDVRTIDADTLANIIRWYITDASPADAPEPPTAPASEPDHPPAMVAQHPPQTTPPSEPATNDAPPSEPATNDAPPSEPATAPAMVKYDAVPRMTAWITKAWPERVRIARDKMAATPDGMRHPNRKAIGTYLGISLRVIELLCDAVGVPRFNIPAPSSIDDVVQTIYDARPPQGSDNEIESEYNTIVSAVNKAYNGTVHVSNWSKRIPPSLQKILDDASIILPASTPRPADAPASMTTTTPEPATNDAPPSEPDHPPAMVAQHPPQTTPTPAPVARAEMVIDFTDIITPHDAAINALTDDIRQHGVSIDMLFSTAADVMATADSMPLPIIASTKDTAHLLMPGVCSLSAPSKIGKSTMALHLAYAVATGGNVFGSERYNARQGTAVYFDLENYTPLTGTRMAQMYDTPPPLYRHVSSERWHTVLGIARKQHVDRWQVMQWYITRTLRTWPDTRLIILDNVIQFQPKPARYETPRDVEERYLLWLAGVSMMHPELCIMLIDHNTKMQSTDKADKDLLHDKQQGTLSSVHC